MRSLSLAIALAASVLASAASGASYGAAAEGDEFTVGGIKVDATGQSPRQAQDVAMAKGRAAAWSKLFQRFKSQGDWGSEPHLTESELLGLIASAEAANERRNTTRYLADVTFRFHPAAVRQVLERSAQTAGGWDESVDEQIIAETSDASTHLAVNVRFNTLEDWATLRSRLRAASEVSGVDIVEVTPNEARIYLAFTGDVARLQESLARHSLQLMSAEEQFTLELGAASATTTASLPASQ